jgi:hypothetical protein
MVCLLLSFLILGLEHTCSSAPTSSCFINFFSVATPFPFSLFLHFMFLTVSVATYFLSTYKKPFQVLLLLGVFLLSSLFILSQNYTLRMFFAFLMR